MIRSIIVDDSIVTKLSAARTRLILERPFLGSLVLRLPMVEAGDWCKTTATDAKTFFYNRHYVASLTLEQTQFMLAHDALHCALLHFARRQHREKHRWDVACDFAVNPLLISDGLKPPPDILYLEAYAGMTAEEIYPLIDDELDRQPLDQHLYDGGAGDDSTQPSDTALNEKNIQRRQDKNSIGRDVGDADDNDAEKSEAQQNIGEGAMPPPLQENEKDQLAVQWQQRMAGAAQTAMQAGKLGGGMARMINYLMQPQLPWRVLLARYMTSITRDDYSFTHPSSRRDEGGAIYPGLRSLQVNVTVIIDTSGSITDSEMSCFISEINAIKGQIRARITLHACDAKLAQQGPWQYEAWQEMQIPSDFQGGGGTDFRPAIEWVNECTQRPDMLIYFTDAQGSFPKVKPCYPVIWLVKGKAPVPFGQRIQLN